MILLSPELRSIFSKQSDQRRLEQSRPFFLRPDGSAMSFWCLQFYAICCCSTRQNPLEYETSRSINLTKSCAYKKKISFICWKISEISHFWSPSHTQDPDDPELSLKHINDVQTPVDINCQTSGTFNLSKSWAHEKEYCLRLLKRSTDLDSWNSPDSQNRQASKICIQAANNIIPEDPFNQALYSLHLR